MNTKFILGFVIASVLIVSMVSAWNWPWSESDDVSLSPGGSGRGSGGSGTAGTGSGGSGSSGSQVRANSCDKDGVCEMQSSSVNGLLKVTDPAQYTGIGISPIILVQSLFSPFKSIQIFPSLIELNSKFEDVNNFQKIIIGDYSGATVHLQEQDDPSSPTVFRNEIDIRPSRISQRLIEYISSNELHYTSYDLDNLGLKVVRGVIIGNQDTSSVSAFRVDEISSTYLAGQGNAYACLDANGKLYRSNTACR